jgi:hypothetical protein
MTQPSPRASNRFFALFGGKYFEMIHYTCDRCGCAIRDERFVARIEVSAAFDPEEISEADLDEDHLEQIADTIAQMESTGDFDLDSMQPKRMSFDLCPNCCCKFLDKPIGEDRKVRLNFSQN